MASLLDFLPLLLKTVPAVKTQMQGKNTAAQQAIMAQMNNLTDASINPENATYKSLLTSNTNSDRGNLAATIAELQAQNRKATMAGQAPLLDQERGGESVFRNLIQGQQQIGDQARTQTLGQINQGRAALTGNYATADDLANQAYQNKALKANAYGNIGDALSGLFGLNKAPAATMGGQSTFGNGQTINWNGPRVGMLE